MKTIETINTLCKTDASLYRAKRDYLLSNIETLDSIVRDAIDNGGKVRDAVKEFVKQVGSDAAVQTVASLVNRSAWDGRISSANANWAKVVEDSWDEDAMARMGAYCKMHMAHLDQTADYIRRNLDELAEEIEAERKAKEEQDREDELRHLFDAAKEVIWDRYEHAKLEAAGIYDYHQAILEDVIEYIRDEVDASEYEDRDALEEALNDDLWTVDSVTGNGSGSYTFDRAKAEEFLRGNADLIQEMASEFGMDDGEIGRRFISSDWEWFDVSIRCYLLGWAIHYALDLLQDGLWKEAA